MDWFFALIWIICGIAAAAIYQKKGRSGVWGFLGGFFLGPIGLLLALASGDNSAKKAADELKKKVENGELKKCPYCAEYIKAEAIVCRHCGKDL